jgi:hypothetical protein
MINLIPPKAKKEVIKEYWVRVVSVWMLILGIGSLVTASLLLPTYVMVQQERSELEEQVAANTEVTSTYDASAAALTTAMQQARLLMSNSDVPLTQYHQAIYTIAGSAITLSGLTYERAATTTRINLQGVAASRQDLASFKDMLEAHPLFVDVVLPIESLIKNKDIDFSVTFTGLATSTTL